MDTDTNPTEVLLIVALKTDQPHIKRRIDLILSAAEPYRPDTQPVAWAKRVSELTANDYEALARILDHDAIKRLNVGVISTD